MGILPFGELPEYPELDFMFKNIWADNADFMSKQYAGNIIQFRNTSTS